MKDNRVPADQEFVVYSERYVYLGGKIVGGKLSLESEVYGDDYDSEQHMVFSDEDTKRLFEIISFEDLIELLKEMRLIGFDAFLKEHDIHPQTIVF